MRLIINLCLLFTTPIMADFRRGGVGGAGRMGAGRGREGEGRRDATVLSPSPKHREKPPHPPPQQLQALL